MIYVVETNSSIVPRIFDSMTIKGVLEYFKDKKSIAVDTETEGFDPHTKRLLTLQLGDEENQFVIDCRQIDILHFKELLESKLLLLHNAKFDYKFFKHVGITLNKIWDTFLAEQVIYCGYEDKKHSLAALCERYVSILLNKDTRNDFYKIGTAPLTDKQIEYAGLDVAHLHQIAKMQYEKLIKYDLKYAAELEFEVVKVIGDIEYNGVLIDPSLWVNNTLENKKKLKEITKKLDSIVLEDPILKVHYKYLGILDDLFGESHRQLAINYSSPAQIMSLLQRLNVNVENTNSAELSRVRHKHPIIPIIEEYREVDKAISTYGESFLKNINKKTGRIHTDIWQILNTYRISSNRPNLQNIPRENIYRNCFVAKDGYSWVSIDYQGQELRIMADYSDEDGFIDVLNRGEDLHCFAGSMMFKKPVTKQDQDLRNKAKTINFGKPLTINQLDCRNAASHRKVC